MTNYNSQATLKPNWLEQARTMLMTVALSLLGLHHDDRRNTFKPCPVCGHNTRENGRQRDPVGMTASQEGWRCHRCKASGDVVSLVAAAITGTTAPQDWSPVRQWFSKNTSQNWEPSPPRRPPPRTIQKPVFKHESRFVDEAKDLYGRCLPILDHPRAARWIASRSFSPAEIANCEDLDLCRVLPPNGALPKWARFGRYDWRELDAVLIFPCFNSTGEIVSVRARLITKDGRTPEGLKTLAPARRGAATNSVMANDLGKLILKTGRLPDFYEDDDAPKLEVIIVEGEPDYLSWALQYSDADLYAPAVFALWSGGWSQEIGDRIPSGARVVARTDEGEAGDRYALEVYKSLNGRCEFFRWKGGAHG